jgi:hypothetical protein
VIVLFVASNPSRSSPTVEPMHVSTNSRKVLDSWLHGLDIQPVFINLIDQPTDNNKPLKIKEVKPLYESIREKINETQHDAVVSLGCTADRVLTDLKIKHESIPHPSTRNRVFNDKLKVKEVIDKLKSLVESCI